MLEWEENKGESVVGEWGQAEGAAVRDRGSSPSSPAV